MTEQSIVEQKSERFQLKLEPSLLHELDEWAWVNRKRSRAEAVRELVRVGLSEAAKMGGKE